jgi:hypothetical protein
MATLRKFEVISIKFVVLGVFSLRYYLASLTVCIETFKGN